VRKEKARSTKKARSSVTRVLFLLAMNNHQPASSSSGTAATGSGSGSGGAGAGAVQQEDEGASSLASLSSSRRATSLQTALAQIREALPLVEQADTDTSDFLEALDRVPYLVEMESNPLLFLKREDFDVTKAAKRLSLYWQFRKQIFEERAFLPMTLTGEGAMTPSDVQDFRKGYQIPLPPNLNGHSVVCTDKMKLYELNPSVRRRCGFYSFQVVSENEKSITEGFVATTLFGDMAAANSTQKTAALATDGIASKVHCNHIFAHPVDEDKISQNNFFANFAGIMLTMLGMDVFQKTFLHVTNSPEENKAKLLAIGFAEDTIPPGLGGTWGQEKLDQWVKDRIALEKQRYAFLEAQQQPPRSLAAASDTKQAATTTIGQQQHQLTQAMEALQQQHLLQSLSSGMGGVGGVGGNAGSLANIHDVASSFAAAGMAPAAAQPTTADQLLLMQYLTASRNVPGITALFPEYLTGSGSGSGSTLPQAAAARTTHHHHHHSTTKLPPSLPSPPPTTTGLPSALVSPEEEYRRHGIESVPTVPETEAIRQAARVAIEETVRTLPDEDKAAYLEARNKCPHLVKAESDTLRFARVENYNAFAAARRLVGYWKLRKVLFGDQRAFLPMTQTGHGALTRDDIVILSCGCVALGRKDSAGRGVVIEDRTKLLNKNEASQQARLRSIFYLLTVLSEEEINQKEGIVWLSNLVTPREVSFSENNTMIVAESVALMPVKVKAIHFVVIPPKTSKKHLVDEIATKIADTIERKEVLVHTRGSAQEIASVLQAFGLSKESLPKSFGGSWKYEGMWWSRYMLSRKAPRSIQHPFAYLLLIALKHFFSLSLMQHRIHQVAATTESV